MLTNRIVLDERRSRIFMYPITIQNIERTRAVFKNKKQNPTGWMKGFFETWYKELLYFAL